MRDQNPPTGNDNVDYIPRSLLKFYEAEVNEYFKKFLEILLVSTGLASREVLNVGVRLSPIDGDECQHLSGELKIAFRECQRVCGYYNPELHEIVVYLGCLGRIPKPGLKLTISAREYTVFHLLVHHLQSLGLGFTRFSFMKNHYNPRDEHEKHLTYSTEVEADYLTRILSFISEEEELKPFHSNRYFHDIWPPLADIIWNMVKVCKEIEKRRTRTPVLVETAICYNPFRWLASRISSITRKIANILDVLTPGSEFEASLANPARVVFEELVEGVYIDRKSLCFSTRDGMVYLCYSGSDYSELPGWGFVIEFREKPTIRFDELTGLLIRFKLPVAKVVLVSRASSIEVEALVKYTGVLPKPTSPPSSVPELIELVKSVKLATAVPCVCDVDRQVYVVPLPKVVSSVQRRRRAFSLVLSEVLIPVSSGDVCIEACFKTAF